MGNTAASLVPQKSPNRLHVTVFGATAHRPGPTPLSLPSSRDFALAFDAFLLLHIYKPWLPRCVTST
jgi:hypothetical protein